jgi:uncharacterized protein (TIGR03437 family)
MFPRSGRVRQKGLSMFRFVLAAAALSQIAFSQKMPVFQWVNEVDSSGQDSLAGLGVDAVGNTYIAGSTYSANFPVKNAVQSHIASAGLYRIDGPGSYAALGIGSANIVAVDPQNPTTLYAVSYSRLEKSVNGGTTFSPLFLPSSEIWSVAINPANDQILYAGTFDQGLFKSTDGGATWAASNGSLQPIQPNEFEFQGIWIDPANPNVLLANAIGNFVRSADGGATWQTLVSGNDVLNVAFDTANPGVVYAVTVQGTVSKSVNDGQTFTSLTTPTGFGSVLPDPNHSGRLIASSPGGLYESDDGGSTWALKINLSFINNDMILAADWANGFLYTGNQSVVRITTDLQTMTPVGPPAVAFIGNVAAVNGHAYVAVQASHDVFVTKLDPSGNILYSTYFGGTADDIATAITVDKSGNVYVTGTTSSSDFPVTKGVYATSGGSFLFKLNSDGTVGYSTYFSGGSPAAIAVDAGGSAYIAGTSGGNLPVTPGAYQSSCNCGSFSTGFRTATRPSGVVSDLTIFTESGFVTKFDPTAATLLYSTYIGGTGEFSTSLVTAIAIAPDGTAYLGGQNGIFHLNAAGSTLLASQSSVPIGFQALALGADGSLYVAGVTQNGATTSFQPTAGAFQATLPGPPQLPDQGSYYVPSAVIAKWDAGLANLLAATYFGGSKQTNAIMFDAAGNVYIGGETPPLGLPARTPLQEGFASATGFLSELSGDLSTLLFSTYLGDNQSFAVQGLGVRTDGSVVIGGVTGQINNANSGPMNVWVNSLTLAPSPALRVDAVENAASLLDGAISAGETVVVQGAGFGSDAQLSISGMVVQPISMNSTSITAVVPASVPPGAAVVQVSSGGASSNQVVVPVSAAAPGIFSQTGSGFGQGYILNKDGTLNTPSNPAKPGDPITVFATGVGPVSFTQGYAVSQYPVNVFVDGFFADGIEAFMGPVQGLPGNVYQIQVFVPNPATLVSANPNLQGFVFPPLVGVTLVINGVTSQYGISFSISQ